MMVLFEPYSITVWVVPTVWPRAWRYALRLVFDAKHMSCILTEVVPSSDRDKPTRQAKEWQAPLLITLIMESRINVSRNLAS